MARLVFTPHLRRYVPAGEIRCDGDTVQAVVERACRDHPAVRSYVLDDQGRLRKHVTVFVDGQRLGWRDSLAVPVGADSEVYVMQALSGG